MAAWCCGRDWGGRSGGCGNSRRGLGGGGALLDVEGGLLRGMGTLRARNGTEVIPMGFLHVKGIGGLGRSSLAGV